MTRTFKTYPNAVVVGDVIVSRRAPGGGHYTDARSVLRGRYDRHDHVVTAVTWGSDRQYQFDFADGDSLGRIWIAANSKVVVRRTVDSDNTPTDKGAQR
jgi:hypothetical protein